MELHQLPRAFMALARTVLTSGFRRDIIISALSWDITRRRVVNGYRRFGTTYRSHLQGSFLLGLSTLEGGTDTLSRNVGNNYHETITTRCRVISQESADIKNNFTFTFSYPEDGVSILQRNVTKSIADYTASHPIVATVRISNVAQCFVCSTVWL
jgi:hypothetical protein